MTKLIKKLSSFKNILVIWAVAIITYIVMANKVDFNNIAMMLCGAVIVYFPVNVKQKEILNKKIGEQE